MKTAVVYHYYEANQNYKDNLTFFLNTGVDDESDFYVFISGDCSVNLRILPNIQYIYIENKNNDFGGVVEFAKRFKESQYDAYVFVNSSMRGPFLPTYYPFKWHNVFTSRLSDSMAITGSSINLLPEDFFNSIHFAKNFDYEPPYIHVQTTAYAITNKVFDYLVSSGFYDVYDALDKRDVISSYELRLSQEILKQGWSLSSILPTQEEFNSSVRRLEYEGTLLNGDPLYEKAFYGRSISPMETLFVKTNRNMVTELDLASFSFTSLAQKQKEVGLDDDGQELLNRMHAFILEDKKHRSKAVKGKRKRILGKFARYL